MQFCLTLIILVMTEHGKVVFVDNVRQGVSAKTGEVWQSLDFVIEVDGRYPRMVKLNLYGAEKIAKAMISVGMIIDVEFEIEAHEYKGSWYNELRVWNIMIQGKSLIR